MDKKWWENTHYSTENVSLKLVSSWHSSKATFISRCEISNRFEVDKLQFLLIFWYWGLPKPKTCHWVFLCESTVGFICMKFQGTKNSPSFDPLLWTSSVLVGPKSWYILLNCFCWGGSLHRFFTNPGLLGYVSPISPVVVAVQASKLAKCGSWTEGTQKSNEMLKCGVCIY